MERDHNKLIQNKPAFMYITKKVNNNYNTKSIIRLELIQQRSIQRTLWTLLRTSFKCITPNLTFSIQTPSVRVLEYLQFESDKVREEEAPFFYKYTQKQISNSWVRL
jgi:hypothetical protein